jgi:sialic acid synthase SpsE
MVEKAKSCGATHIKMQTIFSRNLSFRPWFESENINSQHKFSSNFNRPYSDEFTRLQTLEMNWDEHIKFIKICKDNNLVPMTTCFSHDTLDEIKKCGFETIKIASYDCASHELITRAKEKFKKIFISTGATFDDEIKKTSEIMTGSDYTLMHCVTLYPLNPVDANLNRINWLRGLCPSVGYSDHSNCETDGLQSILTSLYLGADSIECHFTIVDKSFTKDGKVSVNPSQLRQIADFSILARKDQKSYLDNHFQNWKDLLGQERRSLSAKELENRAYYRGRFHSPRSDYPSPSYLTSIKNWENWDQ